MMQILYQTHVMLSPDILMRVCNFLANVLLCEYIFVISHDI